MPVDSDVVFSVLSRSLGGDVPLIDRISVQTRDPFRILVATLLSARTKDEVTAAACERLFRAAPDLAGIDAVSVEELEALVYPVAFYRTKARQVKALCAVLREKFEGRVPSSLEELMVLPGVGRKTANLVVTHAFGGDGLCVDTHVHRIVNRWGYVESVSPVETEMKLRERLPKSQWGAVNTVLVAFGQRVCRPVSPYCSRCPIIGQCERKGVQRSR